MDILFNKTINLLSGMLDYRSKRHKVIVSNIANIDTEDFKPSDISFKNEFGKTNSIQMTTTVPGHIGRKDNKSSPVSFEMKTSEEKVKIDTEMANLAENQSDVQHDRRNAGQKIQRDQHRTKGDQVIWI